MLEKETASAAAEAGIDPEVVEWAAEKAAVEQRVLVNALVVLHAELIGRHSGFERSREYVTVDGTRAYRVDDAAWEDLLDDFDFDDDVASAVFLAHTEQAKLLFAKSVEGDDNFGADEAGVVIGIDTAEQF